MSLFLTGVGVVLAILGVISAVVRYDLWYVFTIVGLLFTCAGLMTVKQY